jgi:hypothetical protein
LLLLSNRDEAKLLAIKMMPVQRYLAMLVSHADIIKPTQEDTCYLQ